MARLSQSRPDRSSNGFDPNKAYKWEPDDIFEITGLQFATLYHMINEAVTQPGGATVGRIMDAHKVLTELFTLGIEHGVIVEKRHEDTVQEIDGRVKSLFNSKIDTNEKGD